MRRTGWRGERGQTLTEYVMILGLLSTIIISLTQLIVPTLKWVVLELMQYMSVNLTSAP